jgi:hypothetical protein
MLQENKNFQLIKNLDKLFLELKNSAHGIAPSSIEFFNTFAKNAQGFVSYLYSQNNIIQQHVSVTEKIVKIEIEHSYKNYPQLEILNSYNETITRNMIKLYEKNENEFYRQCKNTYDSTIQIACQNAARHTNISLSDNVYKIFFELSDNITSGASRAVKEFIIFVGSLGPEAVPFFTSIMELANFEIGTLQSHFPFVSMTRLICLFYIKFGLLPADLLGSLLFNFFNFMKAIQKYLHILYESATMVPQNIGVFSLNEKIIFYGFVGGMTIGAGSIFGFKPLAIRWQQLVKILNKLRTEPVSHTNELSEFISENLFALEYLEGICANVFHTVKNYLKTAKK